jgi:hypothetical protein
MSYGTIVGLQEAQQAMLKAIMAVRPDGGLGRAVYYLAYIEAHRFLVSITHVDTGSYRASQYITQEGDARYRLHIAQDTVNPRTGERPAVYGLFEEARGGEHAAYARTYQQGPAFIKRASDYLRGELP